MRTGIPARNLWDSPSAFRLPGLSFNEGRARSPMCALLCRPDLRAAKGFGYLAIKKACNHDDMGGDRGGDSGSTG